MNKDNLLLCALAAVFLSSGVPLAAAKPASSEPEVTLTGSFSGTVFTGGPGGFAMYDSAGRVIRSYNCGRADDGGILANGNALIANGKSVAEYTPAGEIVFEYTPKEQEGGGTFSCQRLPNGNTVVGENSSGKIVEVDPSGTIVFELQTPHKPGSHNNMRYVRKLPGGNYLTCHKRQGLKEYAPDGTVVWEPEGDAAGYHAIRLANGNTLATTLTDIREYDPAGKTVWTCGIDEIEGLQLSGTKVFLTGLHRLSSGNIVVGIYPKGGCFEITRNKKLVWYLDSGWNGLAVHKLNEECLPLTDAPQR